MVPAVFCCLPAAVLNKKISFIAAFHFRVTKHAAATAIQAIFP
jgi:hypothetical protein